MTKQVGYKVVSVHNNKRWSWGQSDGRRHSGCVEYSKRKWTYPFKSCGPLAVFSHLAAAQFFAGHSAEVWQCEYRPSTRIAIWDKHIRWALSSMPAGSVLAEAVRLVKRLANSRMT